MMWAMAGPIDPRAKIVEELIVRLDKSVRWLADQVKWSHPTIGAWIKGDSIPRKETAWDELLRVLREEEQRQAHHGELKVISPGKLTLRIYRLLSTCAMLMP